MAIELVVIMSSILLVKSVKRRRQKTDCKEYRKESSNSDWDSISQSLEVVIVFV